MWCGELHMYIQAFFLLSSFFFLLSSWAPINACMNEVNEWSEWMNEYGIGPTPILSATHGHIFVRETSRPKTLSGFFCFCFFFFFFFQETDTRVWNASPHVLISLICEVASRNIPCNPRCVWSPIIGVKNTCILRFRTATFQIFTYSKYLTQSTYSMYLTSIYHFKKKRN